MSVEYHKIQTVFLRNPDTKFKTLLEGQWAQPEFEYLAQNRWVFTEKVDGTNIRVGIDPRMGDAAITFGGRTDNAQIPTHLLAVLEQMFLPQRDRLVEMFPDGGTLYGEGYGAKIQKGGGNYRPDQSFVLFDVVVGPRWLRRGDVGDIASKIGIDAVPIIGSGTLYSMVDMARHGFYSAWGQFLAEGIVARPEIELCSRHGNRIITKIKMKDFVR